MRLEEWVTIEKYQFLQEHARMVKLDLVSLHSLSLRISGTKKTYDTGKQEWILSYNTRN